MRRKGKSGRPSGTHPRHRKVVADLRKRLMAIEWPPGTPLPSLRLFASEYNVGLQVIRLAFKVLCTEDRVQVTPRGGIVAKNQGFVVSATSNLVALVLGHSLKVQWQNPNLSELQRGIEQAMGEICDPLLIVHDPSRLRTSIPPDILDLPVRFVMLIGQFRGHVLREYERLRVPVALLDQPCPRWKLSSITVDNQQAAFDATKRLLELGHKRIAFFRSIQLGLRDIDPDSKERTLGFRQAFIDTGIPIPEGAIYNSFPRDTAKSPNVQSLLRASPPYTAVVTVDTGCANRLAEAAALLGLSIPKDISVASFQGKEEIAKGWSGPAIDFEDMGRRAVKELDGPKHAPVNLRVATTWNPGKTIIACKKSCP